MTYQSWNFQNHRIFNALGRRCRRPWLQENKTESDQVPLMVLYGSQEAAWRLVACNTVQAEKVKEVLLGRDGYMMNHDASLVQRCTKGQ